MSNQKRRSFPIILYLKIAYFLKNHLHSSFVHTNISVMLKFDLLPLNWERTLPKIQFENSMNFIKITIGVVSDQIAMFNCKPNTVLYSPPLYPKKQSEFRNEVSCNILNKVWRESQKINTFALLAIAIIHLLPMNWEVNQYHMLINEFSQGHKFLIIMTFKLRAPNSKYQSIAIIIKADMACGIAV